MDGPGNASRNGRRDDDQAKSRRERYVEARVARHAIRPPAGTVDHDVAFIDLAILSLGA
jgi:hypothetical protein